MGENSQHLERIRKLHGILAARPKSETSICAKLPGGRDVCGWFNDQHEFSRLGGRPSLICRRADHSVECEEWLIGEGILDRDDGPAQIEYSTGGIICEAWYRNGVCHNENGPACVRWHERFRAEEEYMINGLYHRDDAPAITKWSSTGVIQQEIWCQKGLFHNERGPGLISYDPVGMILASSYYLNGNQVSPATNYLREATAPLISLDDPQKVGF